MVNSAEKSALPSARGSQLGISRTLVAVPCTRDPLPGRGGGGRNFTLAAEKNSARAAERRAENDTRRDRSRGSKQTRPVPGRVGVDK